jgi:hypothetical protein
LLVVGRSNQIVVRKKPVANERGRTMFTKAKIALATCPARGFDAAAVPKLPTVGQKRDSDRLASRCVIIELERVRKRGHAARAHEAVSNENETNLTLIDWAVVGYAIASLTFYPAMVWFLIS